jgi:hypothetical protein
MSGYPRIHSDCGFGCEGRSGTVWLMGFRSFLVNHGVTVTSSLKVLDFNYGYDVVCLFNSISEAQMVLGILKGSVDGYSMEFLTFKM